MKKSVDYYLNLPYTKEIIKYPDGGYFISVKELPGCMTEADTLEEAFEMIEDAMKAWLEVSIESGDEIPLPESMSEEYYSGKVLLRLPKSLHKKLSEQAKEDGVSLNTYIVKLLAENSAIKDIEKLIRSVQKIDETEDFTLERTYTENAKKIIEWPNDRRIA